MNELQIVNQIHHFITQRYAQNHDKSLLQVYELHDDLFKLSDDFITFVKSERKSILAYLQKEKEISTSKRNSELRQFFTTRTRNFIYQQNQYISFTSETKLRLDRVYQNFISYLIEIVSEQHSYAGYYEAMVTSLKTHFQDLHDFVNASFPLFDKTKPENEFVFQNPVCHEYSPELQMSLWGIAPEKLAEPILDLGCGENGKLVRYLRDKRCQAFGVDRMVQPGEYLFAVDWLDLKCPSQTWGTIISHLAFSNHFVFHHLNCDGKPEVYARKYMELLQSLKQGGTFYYAPSVPFIEELLPASQFILFKSAVPGNDDFCGGESEYFVSQVIRK